MKRAYDQSEYMKLYTRVREDIVKGVYPFGTKLPSKRTMAEKEGISTITVEHAYALLCDEGYAEARERSGYFVIFHTTDGFFSPPQKQSFQNESNLSKKRGDLPEFPFSVLSQTMRRVLSEYGEGILERSPNEGRPELREAVCRYLLAGKGIAAVPSQIIIGAGSEYLYTLTAELFGRYRRYAIESPSYKKIEQVYRAAALNYEKLPLGNDGIETHALWKSSADVLHISPYRSFPSGVTASASKKHEYLRWASEGERYIIEDDFESEFSLSEKPVETLFAHSEKDNVIYLNTFSMTVSPSLRIGYMVLPCSLLSEFREKVGFYSCTVSTYMQLVLAELLDNGDLTRHINRVRRRKRRER